MGVLLSHLKKEGNLGEGKHRSLVHYLGRRVEPSFTKTVGKSMSLGKKTWTSDTKSRAKKRNLSLLFGRKDVKFQTVLCMSEGRVHLPPNLSEGRRCF